MAKLINLCMLRQPGILCNVEHRKIQRHKSITDWGTENCLCDMAERHCLCLLKGGDCLFLRLFFFIEYWELFVGLFFSGPRSKTLCFPTDADTVALQFVC